MLKYKEKRNSRPEGQGRILREGAANPLPISYGVLGERCKPRKI